MKKKQLFNLFILDESGSMNSIKKPTISGFNELVETTRIIESKYPKQEHFITLISFNTMGIKTHLMNEKVKKLRKINEENYLPGAGTPLYDAMGFAINQQHNTIEDIKNAHVLVTIFTDGEENSSQEYNFLTIRKMVEALEQKNWTFTYIGANHDVMESSRSVGIHNSISFHANDSGVHDVFLAEKSARMRYSSRVAENDLDHSEYYKEK